MSPTRPRNIPSQGMAVPPFPAGRPRPPVMPPRPGAAPFQGVAATSFPMLPQISPSLYAMTPIPGGVNAPSPPPDVRAPLYPRRDLGNEFFLAIKIPGADPHKIDLELNATELAIHAGLSDRLKRDHLSSYRGSLNLPEQVE